MRARDIEDIYDLSPIQHGLLYETARAPRTGVYVEQMSIHLEGALDPDAFSRAWQQVVDRHPILRTSFHHNDDGAPLQIVHRRATVAVQRLDWHELDGQAFDERYRSWLTVDRLAGFDLARPPLMRIALIERRDRRWTFAWRFSHLVMDGWSFGTAILDWLAHYRATCLRIPPPQTVRPRPYRDYVAWWGQHRPTDADRRFWRTELDGHRPSEPLRIEGDASAGDGEPTHGFEHAELGALGREVAGMAREHQLTANTVVQGAWSILIGRYLGTDDVIAGGTVAHRPRDLPGSETILGPMIVTLPLRVALDAARPVADWLAELQRRQAAAREHAALPLVEIQRAAALNAPLLETSVSYENVPLPEVLLDDVDMRLAGYEYDGRPHFPLTLVILPGDEMPLRLVYDRRRFGDSLATQLVTQLRALLRSIVDAPNSPLGDLDMRAADDRAAFEHAAARPLPPEPDRTVLGRFDEQTVRRGGAEAVACGEERLSYDELARRSRELAGVLVARGVLPGDRVGLCLERSVDLVVGLIAILRAGAAYVPLDPEYPPVRLELLFGASKPGAVVTRSTLVERLPFAPGEGPAVICVDVARDLAGGVPLPPAPGPGDEMYVLFTSGSTAQPKGVPITHGDVAAMLAATELHIQPRDADVWEMFHSYGFDVSVLELWGALATGGRLVVVPAQTLRSADALVELVRAEQVTITNQTPSSFELFAAAEEDVPGGPPLALRWVILAGERLDPARLAGWIERHGDERPRVVNMFGITETTVVSTWREITAEDVRHATGSPIGTVLEHQRIYVLDERRRPAARGVRGELYVGGRSIARGYLGREDLTAERFVADPFAGGAARMYRTGDVARQCSDGSFEYIGRADDQVQIRGFRVEPAEVEAALRELDGVRQAAVVVRPDRRGEPALVAYVAGELAGGVRDLLADRLPAFVLPAAVVRLDELPRNASGKIDRRALPEPQTAEPGDAGRVAPRNPAEEAMLDIVTRVLGGDAIGVLDELTEHGMHSLAAMRIAIQARRRWGVELTPRALYEGATVASLAAAIDVNEELLTAR